MPVPAAAIVVAAVVGSAAEVGMSVVAAAQERQLTGKGDRQQLERAARARSSSAQLGGLQLFYC